AFDGVVDALCQKLRALPAQAARELLPPEAPLLLRLFAQLSRVPAVAELPPPPDPVTNPVQLRSRAFAAFREVLRRLAERAPPLVIVIDDLQWADPDSLALLAE